MTSKVHSDKRQKSSKLGDITALLVTIVTVGIAPRFEEFDDIRAFDVIDPV